jgi:formylglycine-generating enzyme required for sulfatase activity
MSRIFLSHSSQNNDSAVALRDWLAAHGWDDVFLDLDPKRGIAAGDRWERSLNQAAQRCEAVLFLVTRAWLASAWCMKEFNLAHRLNKRLFGLLIEDIPLADLPPTLTGTWQVVPLASGRDHIMLRSILPGSQDEIHVTFSQEGLNRLRIGLERAGLDARFFNWPPETDPTRSPYPGLQPLDTPDAGIFFGREAPTIETLDRIRGMKDSVSSRLLILLGASGAGKSSFLRAGLLPRLARDDRTYLVIPPIRPEKAAINGEAGLLHALATAFANNGVAIPRAEIRSAIEGGAATCRPLLQILIAHVADAVAADDTPHKAPVLILAIDQGEELFLSEGSKESTALLTLMRELLAEENPALLVIITIRSDAYEQLQTAKALEGIVQQTQSLIPMPRGAYQSVIEGPAARLRDTDRPLVIEPALTLALLSDIEDGGGRDALPLLAFTLERLYLEYGARGRLTLKDYDALGRIKGSIEAAVERAFAAADNNPRIPRDRDARLAILRRGLIPWLAGIDPDTGSPRRQKARLSEIPPEARPLIDLLVEQRLLSTDVAEGTKERSIEPAHESLLRQWGSLQDWLHEDFAALSMLETIKRASRDWDANVRSKDWITHRGGRLSDATKLIRRPDLGGKLDATDRAYIAACVECEETDRNEKAKALASKTTLKRQYSGVIAVLAVLLFAGLLAWWQGQWIREQAYRISDVKTLDAKQLLALETGKSFQDCTDCPAMTVIPSGTFWMGSSPSQVGQGPKNREQPQHMVTIKEPLAVSIYEVTFDEWDNCAKVGDCRTDVNAGSWGRQKQPVINVTWTDADKYAKWLSRITGETYRLLSESEWEYAARAKPGTKANEQTLYSFGNDDVGFLKRYAWYANGETSGPQAVGQKSPNAFGLYDMHGNVWEWVEDCFREGYAASQIDGSAWKSGNCSMRTIRGGSFRFGPYVLRSANRDQAGIDSKDDDRGFRIAREIRP